MKILSDISRRRFLASAAALPALAAGGSALAAEPEKPRYQFCAFEKFVQDLSYDQMAEELAKLGFDGVEATVRKRGHVLPERVAEDLPKLVKALRKQGLEATIIATDVNSLDQPLTEEVLKVAASLGIKRYRMGYYRYQPGLGVTEQLDTFKPKLDALATFNRKLGISALYQNHSGKHYVGSTVWDLHRLLQDVPVEEVSSAFDICHATVEAGLSWPVLYRLIAPHIGAIYVKDFTWQERKAETAPLGTGQVDPQFFEVLKKDNYTGPISLHVEYLPQAGVEKNLAAINRDFGTLKGYLASH